MQRLRIWKHSPQKSPTKNPNRNIPVVGSTQADKCEVPKGGALSGVVMWLWDARGINNNIPIIFLSCGPMQSVSMAVGWALWNWGYVSVFSKIYCHNDLILLW